MAEDLKIRFVADAQQAVQAFHSAQAEGAKLTTEIREMRAEVQRFTAAKLQAELNGAKDKAKEAQDAIKRLQIQIAETSAKKIDADNVTAAARRIRDDAEEAAKAYKKLEDEGSKALRRLRDEANETGRRGKLASEILREGFSEVLEELIKDGSIANELTKAFFAMPAPAKIAFGAIAAGAIAAAAAVAAVVVATKQIFEVAEKVGTKNKEDFEEFAKAVRGAGGEVTKLDRAMAQELLRSADQVKAAFANLFLIVLRESGPELIALLKKVTQVLIDLAPQAQQFGVFLARQFVIANAALTTFVNDAGKAAIALATLFAPRNPLAGTVGIAQRITADINALKDLASIKTDFEANMRKAIADAEKIRLEGFKPATFDDKGRKRSGDQEATSALDILRTQEQAAARLANAEISAARAAFEQRKITIETLERITIDAERRMLAAKLKLFEAERTTIEESKLKATEKAVKIAELDEREAAAKQQVADKILQIQTERFKREEQLRKQNEEDNKRAAEQERKLDAERLKDLQAYLRARIRILEQARRDALDANNAELALLKLRGELDPHNEALQLQILRRRFEIERDSARQIHEQRLASIQKDADAALAVENLTAQQKEAIEKASNARRADEARRFQAEIQQINLQQGVATAQANPASNLSIFGVNDESLSRIGAFQKSMKDAFSDIAKSAQTFGQITRGALNSVFQATQQTFAAFILTGKGGGAAFRQLTAEILAALAVQGAIKAIFEYAEGLAAAARLDFYTASLHFAAAKIYGIVAGVSAGVGLAIGASGGLGGGSQGGGALGQQLTGTRQDDSTRSTEERFRFTERDAAGRPHNNIIVTIKTDMPQVVQHVEQAVVYSYRNEGPVKQVLSDHTAGTGLTTG